MKNTVKMLLVLPVLALLFSVSRFAAPPQCNEGRALGAAHSNATFQQCIAGWEGNGFWDLTVDAVAVGTSPCTYEVTAYVCPQCNGPQPCPRGVACRAVAIVTVDENFNVTSVTCF